MAASHIFKVQFVNQGKVYEIYARKVSHGSLFGFIEVEELVFGERSTVVVDPGEEKIKAEFNEVKRTYLPMHSVLRIDEVKKQGVSKVVALEGSNVAQFPVPIYTPGGDSSALKTLDSRVTTLGSRWVHFVDASRDLSSPELKLLETLLTYGTRVATPAD